MKLLAPPVVLGATFFLGGAPDSPDRELWLRPVDYSNDVGESAPDRPLYEYGFWMQDQVGPTGLTCSGFIGIQGGPVEDGGDALEGVAELVASVAVGEIGHAVAATGIVPMGAWPTAIVIYDPDQEPAESKGVG